MIADSSKPNELRNVYTIKFGFDWPSGFREEDVRIFRSYTGI